MKPVPTTLILLLAALAASAGCSDRSTAPVAPVTAGDEAPAIDHPAQDVPPATAPAQTPAGDATPAAPAISFDGFASARFGDAANAVRRAWGEGIDAETPSEPGGCHYLFPQRRMNSGYGIGFMIEGGRFARIDVDSADIAAPGGGRRGMDAADIRRLYAGRVEERPHKYVDGGRYLRIADPAGGDGVLVFEVDAAGTVGEWRVGVPPQVDYVEACS